jgi:thiosulfate/3-mercaptopyruvate sulfurtransferase
MARWSVVSIFLFAAVALGAAPRVVSTAEWQALTASGRYQILDSRPAADYAAGHLDHALSVSTKDFYEDTAAMEHHFPPFEHLAQELGALGVRSDRPIAVYGDQLQRNREAGMLFFYLYLMGVNDLVFLDGGFQKWQSEGRPVTVTAATAAVTVFQARLRTEAMISKEELLDSLGTKGLVLVDTRSPQEYSGATPGNHIGTPGHIPTALSIEFSQALNPDGTFRSIDELKRLYAAVTASPRIVLYCRTGPRTSPTGLALIALLGRQDVRFYTGSMTEWSNTPGYPVVPGDQPVR